MFAEENMYKHFFKSFTGYVHDVLSTEIVNTCTWARLQQESGSWHRQPVRTSNDHYAQSIAGEASGIRK
jgi:hypothetical protein